MRLNLEALATEPQASVESRAEPLEHLQAHETAPEVPEKPRLEDHPPEGAQARQPHDVNAKRPRSGRNKRKPKNMHKSKDMAEKSPPTGAYVPPHVRKRPDKGAYVPPHLRKRTTAAGSTSNVKPSDHITLDSPQTSDKSQLEKLAAAASS